MNSWRLQRRGPELRVEITPAALTDHEEDAIIVALEGELDAEVEVVHVSGPVLEEPLDGTNDLIRRVGTVAGQRGKRLVDGGATGDDGPASDHVDAEYGPRDAVSAGAAGVAVH